MMRLVDPNDAVYEHLAAPQDTCLMLATGVRQHILERVRRHGVSRYQLFQNREYVIFGYKHLTPEASSVAARMATNKSFLKFLVPVADMEKEIIRRQLMEE